MDHASSRNDSHGAHEFPSATPRPGTPIPNRTEMEDNVTKHRPAFTKWLTIPAHELEVPRREWPPLDTLDRIDVIGWLLELANRGTQTKKPFETAVIELEISYRNLARTSISDGSIADYLQVLNSAQAKGHAVSAPQIAHANAVRTMRLLVAEMMDVLHPGALGEGPRRDFMAEESKENDNEVKTRQILNYLGHAQREGNAQYALQVYVACMRERLMRWDALVKKLDNWGAYCVHVWA
ncbi:hypothetical protein T440DRAFT_474275 [Plenodomus tracheiphilus IPT5]|uniref:Uncharacterized protein n=1 Tax=Plenodomus tracheiphilus IPT5 TaxID=1408161 RepID=A0A6A7BNF5_9PLEO|nr:hypothetical protein T440DRAFT_474275 [Plenodomus tracheiphilus IPT5]